MQPDSVSIFPSDIQFLVSAYGASKSEVRERDEKKGEKDLFI